MMKVLWPVYIAMCFNPAWGMIREINSDLSSEQKKQLRNIVLKDAGTIVPMEQFLKKHHERDEDAPYFVTFRCEKIGTTRTRCYGIDYKVPLKSNK